MPITRAKWMRNSDADEPTVARVEYDDGTTMFVPRDNGNRHYQELMTHVIEDGFVVDDPDPEREVQPDEVPKLALVRAMRSVDLSGARASNTAQSAWAVVRQALRQAPDEMQEDWDMVTRVSRQDTMIQTFMATLPFPDGTDPSDVMDKLYRIADAIDRKVSQSEIDALIDAPT